MNLEETQKIESLESCAVNTSETLMLNDENKADASSESQSDVIKLKQKLLANSTADSLVDSKSKSFPMSNWCLKFTDTNQIFPLAIGVNKIGRAESSEICILNKGVSKSHACIELKQSESNGELEECSIWSCSLVRTCLNQNRLNTDEKAQLVLNDIVQFGNFKFLFCKMSESELKEQIADRTHVLDLTENESPHNKSSNLFEIQNTLDEENEEKPVGTETNGESSHLNSNGKGHQNGLSNGSSSIKHKHLYEVETDPEEESEENCTAENLNNTTASGEFHLEMSQSFLVNQSVASNKTGCSFLVPETMIEEDEESFREEKTNGEVVDSITSEPPAIVVPNDPPAQIESTDEKQPEQEQQETINPNETPIQNEEKAEPIVETLPVVETVQDEKSQEEKPQESRNESVPTVEQPDVLETKKTVEDQAESNAVSNQAQENKEEALEKSMDHEEVQISNEQTNQVEEKETEILETNDKENLVEKQESNEKYEEKRVEPVETVPKEEESFKKPITVSQFGSTNDECIIMSDEEEDNTKQVVKSDSTQSTLIKKSDSEFVIESTILDNSIDVISLNSKNEPNAIEKAETAVDETVKVEKHVETKAENVVPRRGRPSKLNTSTASIEDTKEEQNEPIKDERPRRSTRVSLAPPPAPPAKKEVTVKRTASSLSSRKKPQTEAVDPKEEEKPIVESTNDTIKEIPKTEETKQVEEVREDKVEEKKEENKAESETVPEVTLTATVIEAPKTGAALTRRSSLRIRTQPAPQKPVVEKKEPATAGRYQRKTTKIEEPEPSPTKKEEPEGEEKNTKSQLRRRASLNAKKEEDKPVIARGRRRTIAISSNKQEEIKEEEEKQHNQEAIEEQDEEKETEKVETKRKPRKSITQKAQVTVTETKATKKKQVDTYSYEESDGEKEETKQTLKKKRKSEDVHNKQPALETVTEQEDSGKQTKRKRNSTKLNNSQLNESASNTNKLNTGNSTVSTPKLFFQSKQRQTPQSATTTKQPNKHSINGESPRASASNTSLSASPNKKFKLLQGHISSSEEETSETDEHASKTTASKKLKAQHTNNTEEEKNRLTETEIKNEEKTVKKVAGKKSLSPPKPPTKAKIVKRASINQPTRNSSRNAKGSNMTPKIMATGIILSDKDKQIIENLGGHVVTDVKECTHLITNKIRKTCKFLSCLSRSVFIVTERWLQESNRAKLFLSPATFALVDTQSEKQNKFSLQTSLLKAKSSPLLEGWTFILAHEDSPSEELSCSDLQTIIECSAGQIAESLPSDENEQAKCCILYTNFEKYQNDKKNASAEVLKMTIETFLNSVLKQTFDVNHDIDQENNGSE